METAHSPTVEGFETSYSIAQDIIGFRNVFVNYYFIGWPGRGNDWWLVDTGLPGSSREIVRNAGNLYGKNNPPRGVILTHGHFDHVGGLRGLLRRWENLKIYAHPREIPFITGVASYPPPDPSIRGALARMSWLYPTESAHIEHHVYPLDGEEIPGLKGWECIPTPGHSPGHFSMFRKEDRMLLAGDAFVTTNQNSAYSAVTQRKEMHGPPAYLTIHWEDAEQSIRTLEDLQPEAAATGHGLPIFGDELRAELRSLVVRFNREERPRNGHYVVNPVAYSDIQYHTYDYPKSYKTAVNIGRTTALAVAGVGAGLIFNRFRKQRQNGENSWSGVAGFFEKGKQKVKPGRIHLTEKAGEIKDRYENGKDQALKGATQIVKKAGELVGRPVGNGSPWFKRSVTDVPANITDKGLRIGKDLIKRARNLS